MRSWVFYYALKLTPDIKSICTRLKVFDSKLLTSNYSYRWHRNNVRTFHSHMPLKAKKKVTNVITYKPKSKMPAVQLWNGVTVFDIAEATKRDPDDVLEAINYLENADLYDDPNLGIQDRHVIMAILKRLGFRVDFIKNPATFEIKQNTNKDLTKRPPPDPKELVKRPPVVAIMGHVDHGKTTLLDSLRHSSIVSREFGGITQHIGAFTVNLPQGQITFLDTPGHAAFKTMRARGAHATDLVVLVVAADDGIMEQTHESVRFAREANVPIIVAINKIDKPTHNVDKVKQGLLNCGIQVEDLGGDVQAIPISALKKTNLDQLTEAILIQSEVMGIGGDPTGPVEGMVLEASMDTSKGKMSTALIQRGTLKRDAFIIAGTSWAKVRLMLDEHEKGLQNVTPGMPVQVLGWKTFPEVGEIILEAKSEKHAKEIVSYREKIRIQEKSEMDASIIEKKASLHTEKYRQERLNRLARGRYRKDKQYFREKESVIDERPHLSFVLKGDVHGSVEAILDVVKTYKSHESCRLEVIHSGVGNVTESDVEFAEIFDGLIYNFNVIVPTDIRELAAEKNVVIKPFNVIYHLVADMKNEISNRLPLVQEDDILGEASVLQAFLINEKNKKIPVAGCKCTKGLLKRNNLCKVIRSERVIYNGPIKSLKHEKSDVESIKKDVECGIMIDNPEILFVPDDKIICYSVKDVSQVTDWDPGF